MLLLIGSPYEIQIIEIPCKLIHFMVSFCYFTVSLCCCIIMLLYHSSPNMIYIGYSEFKEIKFIVDLVLELGLKQLYFIKWGFFVWYYSLLISHSYSSSLHFAHWVCRITPSEPRIPSWSRIVAYILSGSVSWENGCQRPPARPCLRK